MTNFQLFLWAIMIPLGMLSYVEGKFDSFEAYGYPNGHIDWRYHFIFVIIGFSLYQPCPEIKYIIISIIIGGIIGAIEKSIRQNKKYSKIQKEHAKHLNKQLDILFEDLNKK